MFNKNFLNAQDLTEDIRFITGSDCHDWRHYPKETENDNTDFVYTYVKCLPCFRGLVMAITDHRRIKTVNSFFNPTETYTKNLQITIDGENYVGSSFERNQCYYRRQFDRKVPAAAQVNRIQKAAGRSAQ